jgi:hypothetical protein
LRAAPFHLSSSIMSHYELSLNNTTPTPAMQPPQRITLRFPQLTDYSPLLSRGLLCPLPANFAQLLAATHKILGEIRPNWVPELQFKLNLGYFKPQFFHLIRDNDIIEAELSNFSAAERILSKSIPIAAKFNEIPQKMGKPELKTSELAQSGAEMAKKRKLSSEGSEANISTETAEPAKNSGPKSKKKAKKERKKQRGDQGMPQKSGKSANTNTETTTNLAAEKVEQKGNLFNGMEAHGNKPNQTAAAAGQGNSKGNDENSIGRNNSSSLDRSKSPEPSQSNGETPQSSILLPEKRQPQPLQTNDKNLATTATTTTNSSSGNSSNNTNGPSNPHFFSSPMESISSIEISSGEEAEEFTARAAKPSMNESKTHNAEISSEDNPDCANCGAPAVLGPCPMRAARGILKFFCSQECYEKNYAEEVEGKEEFNTEEVEMIG